MQPTAPEIQTDKKKRERKPYKSNDNRITSNPLLMHSILSNLIDVQTIPRRQRLLSPSPPLSFPIGLYLPKHSPQARQFCGKSMPSVAHSKHSTKCLWLHVHEGSARVFICIQDPKSPFTGHSSARGIMAWEPSGNHCSCPGHARNRLYEIGTAHTTSVMLNLSKDSRACFPRAVFVHHVGNGGQVQSFTLC